MDKIKLRKGDFIASLLLIAFGIFVVVLSTRMPMKASYGGVESYWYVAPSLFPLFTGSMTIILGGFLMAVAVKEGGAKAFFTKRVEKLTFNVSNRTARTLTVALAIGSFIYIFVPRVDFFISISTFLFFLTTVFYPENKLIWKRLTYIFGIESAVIFLCYLTGVWDTIYSMYVYTFDILALLTLVAMMIVAFRTAKSEGVDTKKIRTTIWLAIIVPAFLCPVFRYALRIPLPHEGLIMDYMNIGFYSARKAIQSRNGG